MMYVLVIKSKKGLKIGRKRYTKEAAETRVKELALIGINMKVMSEQEIFQ